MAFGKPQTPLTPEEELQRRQNLGVGLAALSETLRGGDPVARTLGLQQQFSEQQQLEQEALFKKQELEKKEEQERNLNLSIDALDIPESQKNFFKQLDTSLKSQAVIQSLKQQPRKTVQQNGIHYYVDTGKPVLDVETPAESPDETAAIQNYEYAQNITDPVQRNQFLAITGALKYDPTAMAKLEESKQKAKQGGLLLTPGEKKLDEKFTATAEKWLSSGAAQVDANLANLDNKIARLYSGEENVSGPGFAFIPEAIKPVLAPGAVGFLDEISDITFQSLRETLGAQFTEREANRLIRASFNQNLPEELNIPRLQRLSAKLKSIKQNKNNQIAYWMDNGTLKGYQKEDVTFDSILDSILFAEYQSLSSEEIMERYKQAPTSEERDSILRYAKILKEQEEGVE